MLFSLKGREEVSEQRDCSKGEQYLAENGSDGRPHEKKEDRECADESYDCRSARDAAFA
jgi:hypothetical protein